jgi:hypothetical protein
VKSLVSFAAVLAVVLVPALGLTHPHFKKTVTCQLPGGAEAVITYVTTPTNMAHAESAAVGAFITPRGPSIKLSAPVTAGGVSIPAGEYTIGVVKTGANDWVMALYKGGLARGTEPDMANVIKLESLYSANNGEAEHMLVDITPGHGKFEGRAVLTLHFGTMFLEGALS